MIDGRLDYCNSVLYRTLASNLNRLQWVHKSDAQFITRRRLSDNTTAVLADLHWLPVQCSSHSLQGADYKGAKLSARSVTIPRLNAPILNSLPQHVRTYLPTQSVPTQSTFKCHLKAYNIARVTQISQTSSVPQFFLFVVYIHSSFSGLILPSKGLRCRPRLVSTSVCTWMGDHQGRPGTVNLGPFVSVDLNLWPTVYIADIVLTKE